MMPRTCNIHIYTLYVHARGAVHWVLIYYSSRGCALAADVVELVPHVGPSICLPLIVESVLGEYRLEGCYHRPLRFAFDRGSTTVTGNSVNTHGGGRQVGLEIKTDLLKVVVNLEPIFLRHLQNSIQLLPPPDFWLKRAASTCCDLFLVQVLDGYPPSSRAIFDNDPCPFAQYLEAPGDFLLLRLNTPVATEATVVPSQFGPPPTLTPNMQSKDSQAPSASTGPVSAASEGLVPGAKDRGSVKRPSPISQSLQTVLSSTEEEVRCHGSYA